MPRSTFASAPDYGRREAELSVGVVASDHAALRRITRALKGQGFWIPVVSFEIGEFLGEARDLDLDAVVCDLGDSLAKLPATVGLLRKRLEKTRIVAVVRSGETNELRRALNAGVDGLALESQLGVVLPATVRSACAGQLSVPHGAAAQIFPRPLSYREKQVIAGVAAGLTNGEIAKRLHLSVSTVKGHLGTAFTKLGVRSREEAAGALLEITRMDGRIPGSR
jgi:DNA-binding NarL/FixJ family response regulator